MMPWVPKGDSPCATCWHYSKRHCLSPFECTDALSAKRRDRAYSSDWVPRCYDCNVCGERFDRNDQPEQGWSLGRVTICPDCVDAIERGEVQRRLPGR